ncbi:hypothetical protein CP533_1511 [Ophiocordyceps camponoti-saundersi (nom. inval.)]|nr:hypothetical protein CP533_1511 [Ophiocordyceps camponoti-saundersi (nom. inval.)]
MPFRKWLQSTLGLSRDWATEQQQQQQQPEMSGGNPSRKASRHGSHSIRYYPSSDKQRPMMARAASMPRDARDDDDIYKPINEHQEHEAPPLKVLTRESITEISHLLAQLFPQNNLAICDHAAMTLHGHTDLRPNYVSVLCPTNEAEEIISKAEAKGLPACHLYPRAFYLISDRDDIVRCVRILTCRRFRNFDRVYLLGHSSTPVLSLTCVAERVARDYRRCLDKSCHEAAVRRGADLIWLIAKIIQQDSSEHRDFLSSLTLRFPETIPILRKANLANEITHERNPPPKRASIDGIIIPPTSHSPRSKALLKRTIILVHAATRLRLQGERARAASSSALLWPAPLRLRSRPVSCYGSMRPPDVPPRSRARISVARTDEQDEVMASRKSMELIIGKDIILCRDWPENRLHGDGQRREAEESYTLI